ncbi:hypothetical protein JMUB7547_28650 [Staphylococcus aureus]
MSASLVGSEMCIRDRVSDTRNLWLFGTRTMEPVSYTHLTLPTKLEV